MLYNIYRITVILILCDVICESLCNTLSDKRVVKIEGRLSGLDNRFSKLEDDFRSLKNDVKSINDALSKLLSALKEEELENSKAEHDVEKRAVVSVGSGLSGLPDALLDKSGNSGGEIYTRWGRTTCGSDSQLLYSGYAGGSYYYEAGGGVNYQCMPMDPQYNKFDSGVTGWQGSYMAGVEYQTYYSGGVFSKSTFNQNAPCARCYTKNRPAVMMIPAKRECSEGWTKEYEGYLMAERNSHNHQTTFECVDETPEYIAGEGADNNGGMFYFIKTKCDRGGHCPPYDGTKEMTCVVCSR